MATLSITISDQLNEFVVALAQEEGYPTPSDYLHALIETALRQRARQSLDQQLQDGLDSEPAPELTSSGWDDIEREGLELAASRCRPE